MTTIYPPKRYYTFNHLWVCPQGDFMIVGATPNLLAARQHIAGIQIADPGIMMEEGDEAGYFTLASGDERTFHMPFSGLIFHGNPILVNRPEVWRQDPYGLGWLFWMEAAEPAEIKLLLNARQYREMAELLV